VQGRQRPFAGHPSFFRNDIEILATAAMAAGVGIVLLAGSVTPASGRPFDFLSGFQSQPNVRQQVARPARVKRLHNARRHREKPAAKSDAGAELAAKAKEPLNIIISTNKQQLTLYAGEQPIAHSRVSTGVPGHPTPHGVFSVIQKDRWHRSNIYSNAPMYFMQRITWSGVAMHEGVVPNRPASHGCIRLPGAFARQLWVTTKLGVRVIVARGEVAPVAVSHPNLFKFVPKREPENPEQREMVGSPPAFPDTARAPDAVKAAYNQAGVQPAGLDSSTTPVVTDMPKLLDPALDAAAKVKPLKPGPISVFVSRKEGKIFVRKGFEPVLDASVTIERPDEPLGTHVFTALAFNDDNSTLRWIVVSIPTQVGPPPRKARKGNRHKHVEPTPPPAVVTETATGALGRITIPQDTLDRISELMSPGASLVISDKGLGPETGKGTDFIVLTH
jgi:lipoprotein-anchoring transpeptidase ErfK/SrfK